MPKQTDDAWRIPSKLAVAITCLLLSGAISFNAWAVASIADRPTEDRVKELIVDKSDTPVIFEMLKGIREDIAELKEILRNK